MLMVVLLPNSRLLIGQVIHIVLVRSKRLTPEELISG